MNLSFQEKSLWLQFVGLVGAFGFYFMTALTAQAHLAAALPTPPVDVLPPQVVLFVLAVVLLVIVQIAGHIVIALVDRRSEAD